MTLPPPARPSLGERLPDIPGDSDNVYDQGPITLDGSGKHRIYDPRTGQGWVTLTCPRTGHEYLHLIGAPNKFELLCRGCRRTIG